MASTPILTVQVSLEKRPSGGGMLHFHVNNEIVASCAVTPDQMPDTERRLIRLERKPRQAPERK